MRGCYGPRFFCVFGRQDQRDAPERLRPPGPASLGTCGAGAYADFSIHSGGGVISGSGFGPGPSRPEEVTVIRGRTFTS